MKKNVKNANNFFLQKIKKKNEKNGKKNQET